MADSTIISRHTLEVQNEHLPITSAALGTSGLHQAERESLSLELALQIEGRRRSITLGGALLCIPLAAVVATSISAAIGVPGLWLPLCALLGSALGPALTAMTFAFSAAFLAPMSKRQHRRRGLRLGLSVRDCEEGFVQAVLMLDEKSRKRLLRGRQGDNDAQRYERSPG